MRFGKGQWPQQYRIDDGEDGRARTDPERERGDRDRGEARTPSKQAQRVSNVSKHRLERRDTLTLSAPLFRRGQPAEREQRMSPRFDRIHPLAHVVFNGQLNVGTQLFGKLAITATRESRGRQSNTPGAQTSHHLISSGDRNRSRMAVVCCHSWTARW